MNVTTINMCPEQINHFCCSIQACIKRNKKKGNSNVKLVFWYFTAKGNRESPRKLKQRLYFVFQSTK